MSSEKKFRIFYELAVMPIQTGWFTDELENKLQPRRYNATEQLNAEHKLFTMTKNEFVQYVIIPLVAAGIGAVIGAIMAFRYQRKMEIQRDRRGIMQMVMAYRSVGAIEIDWIKALNMIDIVFHDNKKIKALLRKYLYWIEESRYNQNQHQLVLVELIYEMGQASGYKDLTESDIRDSYSPKAIQSIYASMLSRLEDEVRTSEPPPSTSDEKNNGKGMGK